MYLRMYNNNNNKVYGPASYDDDNNKYYESVDYPARARGMKLLQ